MKVALGRSRHFWATLTDCNANRIMCRLDHSEAKDPLVAAAAARRRANMLRLQAKLQEAEETVRRA